MISWARLFIALVGALIISTAVRADMMSASVLDVDVRQKACAVDTDEVQPKDTAGLFDCCSVADLEPAPIGLSPEIAKDFGGPSLTQDAQILTDAQKSFHPVPSAALLGMLGLGAVGLKLRKYA